VKRFYVRLNGEGGRYVAHYVATTAEEAVALYYADNPKAQRTADAVLDPAMDSWIADRVKPGSVIIPERTDG
jgi:hypothetical protein